MPEYATPAAFRAAVDAHLRTRARALRVETFVLRRQAALERFIARLGRVAPRRWALKGGFALETRLHERARASVDLDLDHAQGAAAAREDLQRAFREDLGDHFSFTITGSEELRDGGMSLAVRYRIECVVSGTQFEPLQVDVSVAAPEAWDVEPARTAGLLAKVGLDAVDVLVVKLERQIAEKLHAYTRRYNGGTTRAKDLVDLVLIRTLEGVDAPSLAAAIHSTFASRATHPVPDRLPAPPPGLAVGYRREAEAVGITTSLEEAHRLVAQWLDPILTRTAGRSVWDPRRGEWKE